MTRILSILILLLCALSISAQKKAIKLQNHLVNKELAKLIIDEDLKNAAIGFYAVDIKTNEIIAEKNPNMSMVPASTQKIFTTATALEFFGTEHRYKTKIQYSGKIDKTKNILYGNIYINGGGDPTLGSKYFNGKNKQFDFIKYSITEIKKAGINSIKGSVIADASIYSYEIASPKWLWEEVGNYYGVAANGLTIHDNLYTVHFKSPYQAEKLTKIIRITPEIPNLKFKNEVLSANNNSDEAYIYGSPYTYTRFIRGTIPKGKDDFKIKGAIPDPAYYLAWRFQQDLDSSGIKCTKKANTIRLLEIKGDTIKAKRITLKTIYSPKIIKIIDKTNKNSNNLFAEHLLNHIGYLKYKRGGLQTGTKAVSNFWKLKGMDTDGLRLYDGSGLSRLNSISAKQFVFLLKYMKTKSKHFTAFYNTLPEAGTSGTLRSLGKNTIIAGNLRAKSGSVAKVRAYAGYVKTKSGRELAFSINISNYNCSSREIKRKITGLMVAMAGLSI
ncbi:MAG: D-alanyl-D-alanine carboxypeptidase/D-alanyl-D-alanine-endopeptidase [Bacteroidetes bacterium 4572_117]|nr:MAG: D-alanyl-D-alanine carboxypeptidase/D-alanyl-D-alanine-endopeptidase [Bacteroidetes bacterium 4572_117]